MEEARWLRWTAVLMLLFAVIAISLIVTGVFDPKPVGEERWGRSLTAETIPSNWHRIIWLDQPLPELPYSVRMTAAQQGGEQDIGYGLVLGSDEEFLAVAVSPLGYVAIWRQLSSNPTFFLPWQPWPHVHGGSGSNEIWVDVGKTAGRTGDQVTVRINRELLWAGEVYPPAGGMGLLAESFGEMAVIDFQHIQLFSK